MRYWKGVWRKNWWSYVHFCLIELLDTKIRGKSLILRKVLKWSRKWFFWKFSKILSKRARQELLKMYTKHLIFLFNVFFLYLCDKCLLCENSICHKNKAVFKNQTLATFLMLGKNSLHDVRQNYIFKGLMWGFFPSFKNVADVWFLDTACHPKIRKFLKMWHVIVLWHVACNNWKGIILLDLT